MKKIISIIKNPSRIGLRLLRMFGWMLSDRMFLKIQFRLKMGYPLNLDNPQTYNEKLQWLKLYNRRPEYTKMVDKYEVKKYVASIIGEEHIIPTLGLWDRFEDIDFDQLPSQFVLKTTNGGGGGGVVVCKDKAMLDKKKTKRIIERSLRSNIYRGYKEWPYKNVKPRIIAEKYMEDESGELRDYKFYCFNGVPQIIMVANDRSSGNVTFDYFDMQFNHLPYQQGALNSKFSVQKPENFEKMKQLAAQLSSSGYLPHIRVDLYNCSGKVFFGELTFFDASGYAEFKPFEWDRKLGDMIDLKKID